MRKSGQTLVEFALVIPLLALMLFAIIQYGFIFAAMITVRNASAIGARQAVLYGSTLSNAQAVAKQSVSPMLNPNLATVSITTVTVSSASAINVSVTYPLRLIIPFVVPNSNGTYTIKGATMMR